MLLVLPLRHLFKMPIHPSQPLVHMRRTRSYIYRTKTIKTTRN